MDEVNLPSNYTHHGGCLGHAILSRFWVMAGFDGCSVSWLSVTPWAIVVLLYISTVVRYRRFALSSFYKGDRSPRFYSRITPVPYEALIAIVLTLPRICWALNVTTDAILKHEAWENADFSHWACWGLVLYMGVFDVLERRLFKKRLLKPYWEAKTKEAELVDVRTILLEGRQTHTEGKTTSQDVEKGLLQTIEQDISTIRQSWRQWIMAKLMCGYNKPTALHVEAQYQLHAFIKAIFTFGFLSEVALSACSLDPKYLLNSQHSIAPALLGISAITLYRFITLIFEGCRFAMEVEWETMEKS